MKIAFLSSAEDLIVLGNICILEIRAHYTKHSLSKSSGALTI